MYYYIIAAAEFGFREVYPSFRFSMEIFVRVSDLWHVGRRLVFWDMMACSVVEI